MTNHVDNLEFLNAQKYLGTLYIYCFAIRNRNVGQALAPVNKYLHIFEKGLKAWHGSIASNLCTPHLCLSYITRALYILRI